MFNSMKLGTCVADYHRMNAIDFQSQRSKVLVLLWNKTYKHHLDKTIRGILIKLDHAKKNFWFSDN